MSKKTILVVDDEEMILGLLHKMLPKIIDPQIEEIEILSASNGQSAIDHIKKAGVKIDLALIDYVLPDMTGLAVINELKKHNPEVSAIVMSGYNKAVEAQGVGASFIKKPFTFEDIKKALGVEV